MIYFECFADEILLLQLGFTKKELEHSFGRSRVCGKLFKDNDSIGFVDEDPGTPREKYLKLFYSSPIVYEDKHILCFRHKKANNRIFILKPDLETLVVNIARELGIDLVNYNLSNTAYGIKNEIKFAKSIKKLDSFRKLVSDISTHHTLQKVQELIK